MEEELLLELEKAYSNGVPFEKIKEAVVAGGMDNQLSIVEDFYKKKKNLAPNKGYQVWAFLHWLLHRKQPKVAHSQLLLCL